MTGELLDLAATPERLRALAQAGVLPAPALERALWVSVESPPRPAWRRFLSAALLGLGALLVLSGVIYFFAYNWQALHRLGKLGVLLGAIALSAVAAWRLGEGLAGQFALLFAAVLVGPLLAVYGQAYQTGADPYGLFLGWAALILPWVALSRFGPLWLLWVVLLDVALPLYWEQGLDWGSEEGAASLGLALALLNGGAWATYEHFAFRGVPWLRARWLPRVLAVLTFAPLLGLAEWVVLSPRDTGPFHVAALALLALAVGASYVLHRKVRSELFLLTLDALSALVLCTSLAGRALFGGGMGQRDFMVSFFLMGLLIIGQLALAVWWLRAESRARGTEDV